MPDREKVLKGLERCKLYNKLNCDKCPYDYNGRGNGKSECTAELATDALELLKEQEAKVPSIMQDVEGIWATCSTCGNKLRAILAMEMDTYFPKYCQECGQAVKWE